MKRDYDLVRKLLFVLENNPPGETADNIKLAGYDQATVNCHLALLIDAGLIKGRANGPEYYLVYVDHLTWAGHDFLDSIREDTVWNKAKEHVLKPVANVAFQVIREWLLMEARKKLGLPVG